MPILLWAIAALLIIAFFAGAKKGKLSESRIREIENEYYENNYR